MARKLRQGDDVITVVGTSLSNGTALEVHRHNVLVKHPNGSEQEYQRGCVFTCMDEALKAFNANRKR